MKLFVRKGLDPTEDWQFNQKHPRGFGGKFGPKPAQVQAQEEAQPPVEDEDPAESETVDSGTNEQDAKVAVSQSHAKNLKKSADEVEAMPAHELVVVFNNRADATKFAIAVDHVQQNDAHTRVTAAANGKYHVEPYGMSATEIDALQEMVHAKTPLSEMTLFSPPEPDPEPEAAVAPEPMEEAVDTAAVAPKKKRKKKQEPKADPANADNLAIATGLEEMARSLLLDAVQNGKVTEATLDEVLQMAGAIRDLTDSHDTGVLPVAEAIHYGSLSGLNKATEDSDLEVAARARMIQECLGTGTLTKGASMSKRELLLLPVRETNKTHDPNENDGKALPLGSHERITCKVGTKEDVTEETAKYPKTGKKADRHPRLILKG